MFDKIIEDLKNWCVDNHIKLNQLKDRLFEIPKFGKLFLLEPINGKIIDEELMFPMDDEFAFEVQKAVEQKLFDYFVFQFGKMVFYCKPELKKNSYNEERFNVDFNDLKYVGENTLEIDIPFNNIGIHTEYEILNGNGLKNYAKKSKFYGCTHVGMCDKNTLAGTLGFQTESKKLDIKSILGMTIDVAVDYDYKTKNIPSTYELKLYVTNFTGWQNLLQINRYLNVEHNKFITEDELQNYKEGLICICGYNTLLNLSDKKSVLKWLGKMKGFRKIFFQVSVEEWDDDQLDVQRLRYLNLYLKEYIKLIPPVLLNDVYYADKEEYIVKDYLNKIARIANDYCEDQYFKSLDEVSEQLGAFFKDEAFYLQLLENMLDNLNWVCHECEKFEIETGERRFPEYESLDGQDNEELFIEIVTQGFQEKIVKGKLNQKIYFERLEKELETIKQGGLISYFLILWDIIKFAKDNDIRVGPGRGSVCGSIIAWLMNITDVDPIYHDLLFERFLNPVRILPEIFYKCKYKDGNEKLISEKEKESLKDKNIVIVSKTEVKKFRKDSADVDVDFESAYRDVIKEYIAERFGQLHTCSVGAYTRFQPRGCVKDLGTVIGGLKFGYLNAVTKAIPNKPQSYTFRDFVEYAMKSVELKKFFQEQPKLIFASKLLFDQPKAESIHASAVLVLPKKFENRNVNIHNWLPVKLMDGKLVSQFEGEYTDLGGYLKEDILGLNQLDKFKNILNLIKQNHGKDIDLNKIDFEDEKTFELFREGHNEDVFQFNSPGLKNYSKKVKPDTFAELTAMTALYRPATIEVNAHLDFVALKHGKKKVKYDYGLEEVTKKTFGLIIYQETMMQSVMVLGNFSAVDADIFRTATKKFSFETMIKFKEQFLKGAKDNGCPDKEAERIWEKILAFSGYTFNLSHSVAYTMMTYQTEWLKANYPLEFWQTAISFASEEDIPAMLSEMNKLKQGIRVKPPSVNNSGLTFTCNSDTNSIYWSLTKIKGLGIKTIQPIIDERVQNGPFQSYEDFATRVPKAKVNKRSILSLILAGALDEICFVKNPLGRLGVIKEHCKFKEYDIPEEFTLFENINKEYYWINRAKILTGLGTVNYKQFLKDDKRLFKLYKSAEDFFELSEYSEVCVAGKVVEIIRKTTKKGDDFVILEVLSNDDKIKVLIWSNSLEQHLETLGECMNKQIYITGKVRYDTYQNANSLHMQEESKLGFL